jgi:hypothetical protein
VPCRIDDNDHGEPPIVDRQASMQRRHAQDIGRQAVAPSDQHAPCSRRRFILHCGTGDQLYNFPGLKGSPRTKPVISDQQSVLELHDGLGSSIDLDDPCAAVRNDDPCGELIERLHRDGRHPLLAVNFREGRSYGAPQTHSSAP